MFAAQTCHPSSARAAFFLPQTPTAYGEGNLWQKERCQNGGTILAAKVVPFLTANDTGVVNLVGKTDTRAFIRLMHHADGVVCPVTFAMHLAAAVETRPGRPRHRPCVVIAGGREPTHWEAYPHHQYLSMVGALPCCADGGCWKSRCQLVGDGDAKDRHDVCVEPVQITPDLRIPRCMDMITPRHVIDRIEHYYQGGVLKFSTNGHTAFF